MYQVFIVIVIYTLNLLVGKFQLCASEVSGQCIFLAHVFASRKDVWLSRVTVFVF